MALPIDLGVNDAGFLLAVVDYNHLLRWSGTIWEFAPGDPGNGFFADRAFAPRETGWALCDGSQTTYLNVGSATLSTTGLTLPADTAFHKGVSVYTGGIVGAVAPSIGGDTADEASHTHAVDPPSTTSAGPSAVETVDQTLAGATVDVSSATHTHATDIGSFASGAGGAHHHASGSLAVGSNGTPAYLGVLRYFRR